MKVLKFKIMIALLLATTSASAGDNLSPVPLFEIIDDRPIAVEVIDRATGGCWTNVEEVRQSILTNLEKNLFVSFDAREQPAPHNVILRLEMTSSRTNEGQCLGHASMKLTEVIGTKYRGRAALIQVIAKYINTSVSSYQDHNRQALRLVDLFIDGLPMGLSGAVIYVQDDSI